MLTPQEIANCLQLELSEITDGTGKLLPEYQTLIDTADDVLYAYVQDVHTSTNACVITAECQQLKYLDNNQNILDECNGLKQASITNFSFTVKDTQGSQNALISTLAYNTLYNCGLISMRTNSCYKKG